MCSDLHQEHEHVTKDSRDLSKSGMTKLAWVATRYPKSTPSKNNDSLPAETTPPHGVTQPSRLHHRILCRLAEGRKAARQSSPDLHVNELDQLDLVPLKESESQKKGLTGLIVDGTILNPKVTYGTQLSDEQYLIPSEKENISRKSSSADSAIDLQGNFSSEEGQDNYVGSDSIDMQPQSPDSRMGFVSSDESRLSPNLTHKQRTPDEALSEGSKSPRMGFREAQTPSFTQINHGHLPAVIISDHSHDNNGLEDMKDPTLPHFGHKLHVLERKLSNSSVVSDHSESGRSYTSDSSYSLDDDEYDLNFRTKLSSENKTVS